MALVVIHVQGARTPSVIATGMREPIRDIRTESFVRYQIDHRIKRLSKGRVCFVYLSMLFLINENLGSAPNDTGPARLCSPPCDKKLSGIKMDSLTSLKLFTPLGINTEPIRIILQECSCGRTGSISKWSDEKLQELKYVGILVSRRVF